MTDITDEEVDLPIPGFGKLSLTHCSPQLAAHVPPVPLRAPACGRPVRGEAGRTEWDTKIAALSASKQRLEWDDYELAKCELKGAGIPLPKFAEAEARLMKNAYSRWRYSKKEGVKETRKLKDRERRENVRAVKRLEQDEIQSAKLKSMKIFKERKDSKNVAV